MVNFKTFDKCIIGGSHTKEGKVCQDYSTHYSDDRMCIGVVADGYGAASHFRSDRGSQLAAKTALAVLIDATNRMLDMDPGALARLITENGKDNGQHPVPGCMFDIIKQTIVKGWRASVDADFQAHPFTEEELSRVQKKYIDRLNNQNIYYWAYGTTLIASVVTKDFWYAIQVGDGNCVAIYTEESRGGLASFVEDMPKDPFVGEGEATTSMCQANVIEGFRHYASYTIPKMILVHTDGIDDSLLDDATRQGLYFKVGGSFAKGEEWAEENIEKGILTFVANNWKGDDTSMAVTYTTEGLDVLSAKLFEIAQRRQSEDNYQRAKANVEKLEGAVKGLTTTIAQEDAQIAEARRKHGDLGEQFKRAGAEIEECERRIAELQARIEAIRKQREQIKVQAEQLKSRGMQVESLKKSNIDILAAKKKELDELRAKIAEYERKNGIGQRKGMFEMLGDKVKELFGGNNNDNPVEQEIATPTVSIDSDEPVAQPEQPIQPQPEQIPVAQPEQVIEAKPTTETPTVTDVGGNEPLGLGSDEPAAVAFDERLGRVDEPKPTVEKYEAVTEPQAADAPEVPEQFIRRDDTTPVKPQKIVISIDD